MRPAVMIGTEDRILNPWAQFAKNYSFLPLIGDGSTKYIFNAITYFLRDGGAVSGTSVILMNFLFLGTSYLCPNDDFFCRIQPVYVVDVAAAIVSALKDDGSMGKIYELGGPEIYTMHELVFSITLQFLFDSSRLLFYLYILFI